MLWAQEQGTMGAGLGTRGEGDMKKMHLLLLSPRCEPGTHKHFHICYSNNSVR